MLDSHSIIRMGIRIFYRLYMYMTIHNDYSILIGTTYIEKHITVFYKEKISLNVINTIAKFFHNMLIYYPYMYYFNST